MFCPRCNGPLEEGAAFCGVCGALIKPKSVGETVLEESELVSPNSRVVPDPTVYDAPEVPVRQLVPTVLAPEYRSPDEQPVSPRSKRGTPEPPMWPQMPSPGKKQKKISRFFVFLVSIAIVVVAIGSISLFLMRRGSGTTSPAPATTVVTKGQVSFLDSQNNAPGVTDALKITATNLPNPPDGSTYDAWLIDDSVGEQILPLGSLSKSDPNTFALAYPNADSPSLKMNLIGAGNRIEVTQEQGTMAAPAGKVVLSATFPPQAFVHIRHLLFKFPTTPGTVGLLPGLINETQKVNTLSQLLQNDAATSNTASVPCIAQAVVNVIEGDKGAHFQALPTSCKSVGIGSTLIGDGFGIMRYITTITAHAALAASQSDATDTIRLYAKNVETSTASVTAVITQIDKDALQLLANPTSNASLISDMVSLSDRAYHGFDQNGNGEIEPIVGEAGVLTAYTNGQRMATLSLS